MVPLMRERPWLGHGPDMLRFAFASRFPPELVYYQGRGLDVDRAHNLWLDLASQGGVAALLAYFAVLISFGRLAYHKLRQHRHAVARLAWVGLVSLVVGHLVEQQASFETVATGTIFWLSLGLAVGLDNIEAGPSRAAGSQRPPLKNRRVATLTSGAVAAALIAVVCVRPLLADVAYRDSLASQGRPAEGITAAELAVRRWPIESTYRLGLADYLAAQGDFAGAIAQLSVGDRLRPNDAWLWAAIGSVYARWSDAQPAQVINAVAAYERALTLSPNTAGYHAALGSAQASAGRLDEAVTSTERAVELDATDARAYWQLAGLYRELGWEDDAARAEAQAYRWSQTWEPAIP
jgi:tetratricopeptide (TPR) repeat protein